MDYLLMESNSMNLEYLRLIRNILYRSAAVAAVLSLIFWALTFGMWETWSSMCLKMYNLNQTQLMTLCIDFFTQVKFLVWYVFLTPALAIHWTIKREFGRKIS